MKMEFQWLASALLNRNRLRVLFCFGWGTMRLRKQVGICFHGRAEATVEEHDACARRFDRNLATHELGGGGQLRLNVGGARAGAKKNMTALPLINLLVVTVRTAWFNFRGWNKRR
jgi:hypothetical protein